MQIRTTIMLLLAAGNLAACGGSAKPAASSGEAAAHKTAPAASLYDRLGGMDAIKAVVKYFTEERVAKDPRINGFFANTDIPDFEAKLADQICEASGGPCTYKGKTMKESHAGMKVRDVDFDITVEHLKATFDHFKVGAKEQQELLAMLAPMRSDIVTK